MADNNDRLDNPDVRPQQTWYNWAIPMPPSVTFNSVGQGGGTAITTINVDAGPAAVGPVIQMTGGSSGFLFTGSAPARITLSSPLTAKGDLYTHNTTTGTKLAVGTNGFVLSADSTQATGLKWIAASSLAVSDFANIFALMGA